jgi:hypothetical protein
MPPDDGVDRGIASFFGCASLVRQFEFAQNVWVNDPKFHELENERDPIIGAHDGTFDMTIPKRPVRRKIKGPSGVHHGQGRRVIFPSRHPRVAFSRGRRQDLADAHSAHLHGDTMAEAKIYVPKVEAHGAGRTYNQIHVPRPQTPGRRRVSIYVC